MADILFTADWSRLRMFSKQWIGMYICYEAPCRLWLKTNIKMRQILYGLCIEGA